MGNLSCLPPTLVQPTSHVGTEVRHLALTSSPPTQARSRDGRHWLLPWLLLRTEAFPIHWRTVIHLFAFGNRVVADARLLAWTSSTPR
ncbi:hypothetical protein IG631_13008 [Alternaria alternata]|nr:hypothetical protein IG631_13008 [Alternaria alternata]